MTTSAENYQTSLKRFSAGIAHEDSEQSVYVNNYIGVHIKALQSGFPAIYSLLGHSLFYALARVYLKHYPPTEWDINLYGAQFAHFVALQSRGAKAAEHDWLLLAQLAAIESAISSAYYQGSRDVEWVTLLDPELYASNDIDSVELLCTRHRYLQCDQPLYLHQAIAVWREGLVIRLANRLPNEDQ